MCVWVTARRMIISQAKKSTCFLKKIHHIFIQIFFQKMLILVFEENSAASLKMALFSDFSLLCTTRPRVFGNALPMPTREKLLFRKVYVCLLRNIWTKFSWNRRPAWCHETKTKYYLFFTGVLNSVLIYYLVVLR